MPDMKSLFDDRQVGQLVAFVEQRSGKSGLLRYAGQLYAKKVVLTVQGDDGLANWFAQTVMMAQTVGLKYGVPMPDGSMRYCNMTNGGPVFVHVKDGRIVRMTPIDRLAQIAHQRKPFRAMRIRGCVVDRHAFVGVKRADHRHVDQGDPRGGALGLVGGVVGAAVGTLVVGIAPVKPAEFLIIRIGQSQGGTSVETA